MNIEINTHYKKIKIYLDDKRTNFIYSCLPEGNYCFKSGEIYGLVGAVNSFGTAISYLMTGWSNLYNNKIMIDKKVISQKELQFLSCYVQRSPYHTIPGLLSVREEINKGIKKIGKSAEEIIRKFSLTENRLDRKLVYTGNESWRASLAIGYAYDKKIFCFPYVDKICDEELQRINLTYFIEMLKKDNCIIIIPTYDNSKILDIADKKIELY